MHELIYIFYILAKLPKRAMYLLHDSFQKKCVGLLQSSHHCRHTVEAESPPEALTPQRRMIWEKIKPCNASAVISVYTIAYEKRTKRTKRTNFQFSSKNLWYSILTLSSVAFRPIFIAT